jgi:hypothetical protein
MKRPLSTSGAEWGGRKHEEDGPGVTSSPTVTVQHLLVRNLVERDDAGQLVLTEQGRAVLAALLRR